MLQGKILHDGHSYFVSVGSVHIDVSGAVHELLAKETARSASEKEQEIRSLQARYADIASRYRQIESIILAGSAGMPTGDAR